MGINATLIVQMITFALFVWFTMKFVWPPITKAMKERQARISSGLAAADKGAKALEEAAASADAEIKSARTQAQDILANASKQASKIVEDAKATAQTEADRIKAAGRDEVERELASAREALRKQVGELAVLGAARILKRELDASAHADVIEALAAKI